MKFSTSLTRFGSVGDLGLEMRKLATAVAAGWNVEHKPDGTHKAIHTTSVYERGRSTPMGEWTNVPFNAAQYSTLTGGATWVVTASHYSYTLVGKTVTIALVIAGTGTTTGAPGNLTVTLPAGLPQAPVRVLGVPFAYSVAGVAGTGLCQIHPAVGTVLLLTRDVASTAFGAGATYIYLQIHYAIA